MKDGKLAVTFDARDYLDRVVKGTAATYTATVTRVAEPEKLTLNPELFVKPEGGPPGVQASSRHLPDDERLITLANGVSAMSFAGFGSRHVGTREGNVPVAEDGGEAHARLATRIGSRSSHTVTISGVFTDDTGRENRSVGTFKLDQTRLAGVKVSTPKELFATGEKDSRFARPVRPQGRREDSHHADCREARLATFEPVGDAGTRCQRRIPPG